MLTQVSIRNVRNVAVADFNVAPKLTLFKGDNGAGKSSLLEGLHLLSRAGTFRTRQLSTVVGTGATSMSVSARLSNGAVLSFGYSRGRGTVRAAGTTAVTLKEAALLMPSLALTSDSLQLLSGPPSDRRSFMDWLVFHVKHSFHQNWTRYRAGLSQRNALLRQQGHKSHEHARIWAGQIEASAVSIHEQRREVLEAFSHHFEGRFGDMFSPSLGPVKVSYAPGWDTGLDWLQMQEKNFESDVRRGRTEQGPHRADLRILIGNRLAGEVLSRGQQKALVMRLYLVMLDEFHRCTGKAALILVDDITSELDNTSAHYIAAELVQTQHQVVATILADDPFRQLAQSDSLMFHVKHGTLTEFSEG